MTQRFAVSSREGFLPTPTSCLLTFTHARTDSWAALPRSAQLVNDRTRRANFIEAAPGAHEVMRAESKAQLQTRNELLSWWLNKKAILVMPTP